MTQPAVGNLTDSSLRWKPDDRTHPVAVTDAGALYRTLAPAVLGYLRSQGAEDPEDLLGEVFYQVARDLHSFEGGPAEVRRWVFTVARHRLIDDRRRRLVRPLMLWRNPPEVGVEDRPDLGLDVDLLEALRALTPRQREVLALRFVSDLPLEDVARITRRRVGAVKALQHRGLEALRRLLA